MSDEPKALTRKQQVFVDEYLKTWNAAEAARRAGYSAKTAREQGYDLLKHPHISSQIEARLSEVHMSADEALKLTADIARGDLADFMSIGSMGFNLDLDAAREAGKTNLIRRVSQKTIINGKTDTETHILDIELYDRQAALRDLLKVHGKFKEPGTPDNPMHIKVTIGNDSDKDA
jgi:phage terminase small subunit